MEITFDILRDLGWFHDTTVQQRDELRATLEKYAPAVPQPADERPLRAALERYFSNGGPDTPIRTTWHEGGEHWEAPAEDIRALIENARPEAEVKAAALREAADDLWNLDADYDDAATWLAKRADELEGK